MKKEWSTVEILRHSRHDWLNKVQLIKGNLSLGKFDRVNEIIEEIIIESQNEAKLTNLKLEALTTFLMTYNWEIHNFTIEFEILGEVKDLSKYDETITRWCTAFFSIIDNSVDMNGENHLVISIELFEEEVRFLFDFSGIINNTEQIADSLRKEHEFNQIQLIDYEVHNHEFVASISLVN